MKILIYDTNYMKGASRMIGLIKIKYWQKQNCEITILCSKDGEEFYRTKLKNITYIPINYTYHMTGSLSVPREYIKINFIVLKNLKKIIGKFDIVYSQCALIDFLFVPWLLKIFDKKVKWFVMIDNTVPSPSQRPGPFLQKLIPYLSFLFGNQLLKNTNGIFVVTDRLKWYYERLGVNKVIKTNDGYGIEREIFEGPISSETPKVNAVYSGRLHIAKGILDLVEVVKIIVKDKPDFKIAILGDGDNFTKNEFLKKIKIYNLQKNFLSFGYIAGKEKGDIYRKSDFYISLSYDESFGHSILEALACNKMVIAYNLPVYHEVFNKYIKKGQLILFKKKEYKKIANYILQENFNHHFDNKLIDYSWDNIVINELKAMRDTKI